MKVKINGKEIKKNILEFLKHNIIFIIGTILLIYKGLLLSYLIDLQIGTRVIKYIIIAGALLMCPTINNRKKFGYIYSNIMYLIVTIIIFADF